MFTFWVQVWDYRHEPGYGLFDADIKTQDFVYSQVSVYAKKVLYQKMSYILIPSEHFFLLLFPGQLICKQYSSLSLSDPYEKLESRHC